MAKVLFLKIVRIRAICTNNEPMIQQNIVNGAHDYKTLPIVGIIQLYLLSSWLFRLTTQLDVFDRFTEDFKEK